LVDFGDKAETLDRVDRRVIREGFHCLQGPLLLSPRSPFCQYQDPSGFYFQGVAKSNSQDG
jgi:hypothetical protein